MRRISGCVPVAARYGLEWCSVPLVSVPPHVHSHHWLRCSRELPQAAVGGEPNTRRCPGLTARQTRRLHEQRFGSSHPNCPPLPGRPHPLGAHTKRQPRGHAQTLPQHSRRGDARPLRTPRRQLCRWPHHRHTACCAARHSSAPLQRGAPRPLCWQNLPWTCCRPLCVGGSEAAVLWHDPARASPGRHKDAQRRAETLAAAAATSR